MATEASQICIKNWGRSLSDITHSLTRFMCNRVKLGYAVNFAPRKSYKKNAETSKKRENHIMNYTNLHRQKSAKMNI